MSFVINFLTSPAAADFVQQSSSQVLSEGTLKAVGRPVFTMMDNTASKEERKYSASKELIYQTIAMLSYLCLIFPIKNNTFRFLKHFSSLKDLDIVNAKTSKEFKEQFKKMPESLAKTKVKGAQELMSIVASGIILAGIIPNFAVRLSHPVMKKLDKNA